MAEARKHGCPRCDRLQAEIAELKARLAASEAKLAKARKHSGNSSKPPSSDITAPPKHKNGKAREGTKNKRGGQHGHPRHERPLYPTEQVDDCFEYLYGACPCCNGTLSESDAPPKIVQNVEIEQVPVIIQQHQSAAQYCEHCDKVYHAPFPEKLAKAGLIGPRLTALVGFFKGACHMSFSTIRKFFRDVIGVPISRGLLAKLIRKVSASLQDPYEELLRLLPGEAVLNVDETGHKDNGARLWTWCFRASLYTLFKIAPSRGSKVLIEVLGKEFDGVLGCDYFSAYRKYLKDFNVTLQFCLAHFIRDVKFLAEHPQRANRIYGKRLLEHLRALFGIIHRRDEYRSEECFRQALARVRNDLVSDAILTSPGTREADNLANRFCDHFDSYFEFITTPGIEPTNNLAEQAIRFVAIHRRLTQGTRSETGQTWCERIWSIVVTCAQQGRSVFDFLHDAVCRSFAGEPGPSLLPDT